MCIKFEHQLPEYVQTKIKAIAGRNKVLPFATRLISLLLQQAWQGIHWKEGIQCLTWL